MAAGALADLHGQQSASVRGLYGKRRARHHWPEQGRPQGVCLEFSFLAGDLERPGPATGPAAPRPVRRRGSQGRSARLQSGVFAGCTVSPETALKRSLARAEALLPGNPAPEGKVDPRWQAMLRVADFLETHPEEVWRFVQRWGKHAQADLRAAVATCLLEHLLEHHLELLFPRVRTAAVASRRFADTLLTCWAFGRAKLPGNFARLERLKQELWRRRSKSAGHSRRPVAGGTTPCPTAGRTARPRRPLR